jgi:radical SAM protein with 4Fe4S-binding SPASM domain
MNSIPLPAKDDSLEVILKLTGETCNINCFYCYEKRKPYAEARYLPLRTVETLLQGLGKRSLSLHLLGGEPLLYGRERLAPLLALFRKYPGNIRLGIQTNATLLDAEWIDFFAAEWPSISIGVSFDGPGKASEYRVDYANQETTEFVESALRRLQDRNISAGVIAVISRSNISDPHILLEHFAKFRCIKAVNFAPCFDYRVTPKRIPKGNRTRIIPMIADRESPAWAVSADEYADFLCKAFDYWRLNSLYSKFAIDPFMSAIRSILGKTPTSCHFSSQKCGHSVTIYPDGTVGSCDEIEMPLGRTGHLEENAIGEILGWAEAKELRDRSSRLTQMCETCDYRTSCGGGCIATRMRFAQGGIEEEYCSYRIKFLSHIAETLQVSPRVACHG